jgi:hypothetical protein
MFSLTEADRPLRILACADGPASFNAEWTEAGGRVVSIDPAYGRPLDTLIDRFETAAAAIMRHVAETPDLWSWAHHRSPDALVSARRSALELFVEDYARGLRAGRYIGGSLPAPPVPEDGFDLAICSHFLFLYSHLHDAAFHVAAILGMLKAAPEARIFPLVDLEGRPSAHLDTVRAALRDAGAAVEVRWVDYEMQRGANRMLVVRRAGASAEKPRAVRRPHQSPVPSSSRGGRPRAGKTPRPGPPA